MNVKCRGCGGGSFKQEEAGARCLGCNRVQHPVFDTREGVYWSEPADDSPEIAELRLRAERERVDHVAGTVRPFVHELVAHGRVSAEQWEIGMNTEERRLLTPLLDDATFLKHLMHCMRNVGGGPGTYGAAVSGELADEFEKRKQRLSWGWRYQLAKEFGAPGSSYGKGGYVGWATLGRSPGLTHELEERYERIKAIVTKRQEEPAMGWLTGFAEVRDEVYPDTELAEICRRETARAKERGEGHPEFVGHQEAEKVRRARPALQSAEVGWLVKDFLVLYRAAAALFEKPGDVSQQHAASSQLGSQLERLRPALQYCESVREQGASHALTLDHGSGVREYVWMKGQPCEVFCGSCGQLRLWAKDERPVICGNCNSGRITPGPLMSTELAAMRRGWQQARLTCAEQLEALANSDEAKVSKPNGE